MFYWESSFLTLHNKTKTSSRLIINFASNSQTGKQAKHNTFSNLFLITCFYKKLKIGRALKETTFSKLKRLARHQDQLLLNMWGEFCIKFVTKINEYIDVRLSFTVSEEKTAEKFYCTAGEMAKLTASRGALLHRLFLCVVGFPRNNY